MNAMVNFSGKATAITFALSAALGTVSLSHAASYEAGKDYIVLDNPEKIDAGNMIVVREFFWYGCPHCYHLDPHAQQWKKTKANDVAFFHTPAPFNPVWQNSAKGFYAAQKLGVADKAHKPLFKAVQDKGEKLFDQNSLANFYAQHGADKKAFNSAFNSFEISTKLGRAKQAAQRYQLTGVPAVVVQGKYVVKGSDAKTFQVVDYLVNKVRNEEIKK